MSGCDPCLVIISLACFINIAMRNILKVHVDHTLYLLISRLTEPDSTAFNFQDNFKQHFNKF